MSQNVPKCLKMTYSDASSNKRTTAMASSSRLKEKNPLKKFEIKFLEKKYKNYGKTGLEMPTRVTLNTELEK